MEAVTTEVKRLEESEMSTLRNLQDKYAKITAELGRLATQQIMLDDKNKFYKSEYKKTFEEESKFLEELNNKYGEGVLDVESGQFTPKKK